MKYKFYAIVHASVTTEVEAETKEEAREKFEDWVAEDMPSLCHHCSDTYDMADGEVDDSTVRVDEVR